MRTPEAGLDEQTKQKLDRIADRAARITAFISGILLIALGVAGCAYVLSPFIWPATTVNSLRMPTLGRYALLFSVPSLYLGVRILRGAIRLRKP